MLPTCRRGAYENIPCRFGHGARIRCHNCHGAVIGGQKTLDRGCRIALLGSVSTPNLRPEYGRMSGWGEQIVGETFTPVTGQPDCGCGQ